MNVFSEELSTTRSIIASRYIIYNTARLECYFPTILPIIEVIIVSQLGLNLLISHELWRTSLWNLSRSIQCIRIDRSVWLYQLYLWTSSKPTVMGTSLDYVSLQVGHVLWFLKMLVIMSSFLLIFVDNMILVFRNSCHKILIPEVFVVGLFYECF